MMIHEKLISGQFLLDLKNDRSSLLNNHHHTQHNLGELHSHHQQHSGLTAHYLNQHHRHQSAQFQQQPSSPQMSAIKMDLYAAYAYQQQQQQQKQEELLNNNSEQENYNKTGALDLSRRCDSVETPRKTPSPGHTNSSIGTVSPATSPSNDINQTQQQHIIPSNLLYSVQAQQNLPLRTGNLNSALPAGLASLYPALYYSNAIIKPEPLTSSSPSSTPPLPPLTSSHLTNTSNSSQFPIPAASELLQTFANAATVSANSSPTTSSKSLQSNVDLCKSPVASVAITTPTSPHLSSLASLDAKNTRPFKAFPRDPLVIAANFAATDVLLDNPRVERYTEYRKRVLEQIRSSNGGTRTVTNPKMRRINSRHGDISGSSICRSSSEERQDDDNKTDSKINVTSVDESSDCDSNAGSFADQTMAGMSDSQTGKTSSSGVVKDAAYYERRRKNNAAAKKSRDRRRIKEDEIAIRAAYLERQNIELLCQIDALKAQIAAFTSKVGA